MPLFNLNLKNRFKKPLGTFQSVPYSTTNNDAGVSPAFASTLPPKLVIPPVLHPTPYRRLRLYATQQGLLICPDTEGSMRPSTGVLLKWGSHANVRTVSLDEVEMQQEGSARVWGIIGALELFDASYLLVITQKADIGQLFKDSHSVHLVKGASAIPLENQARAAASIRIISSLHATDISPTALRDQPFPMSPDDVSTPTLEKEAEVISLNDTLKGRPIGDDASLHVKFDSGQGSDTSSVLTLPRVSIDGSVPSTPGSLTPTGTGATVPTYFASKMSFWKRTLTSSGNHPREDTESTISAPHPRTETETSVSSINEALASTVPTDRIDERRVELEEKVVRECIKEFSKGQMFFSLDFDITRSLQHKHELITTHERQEALIDELDPGGSKDASKKSAVHGISPLAEPNANLPLWRRVDRKFWWNENLSNLFVEAGLHDYVLPLMQGFVQIATFNLPDPLTSEPTEASVRYSIISRRSRERAGLRYQRRGIDGNANVANFVETETIVQVKRETTWNVFSHLQIRGSIPLFWSQPGTSLKPPPRLDKPWAESMDVVGRHFDRTIRAYGPHTAVNLAELTGKEGIVTSAYREAMHTLNRPQARYHEFDFHRECAGMKYENISKLLSQLEKTFDTQGFFWVSGPLVLAKQNGIFRVNCIDCLDRTNVVMSAFARHVLNSQLQAVGFVGTNTEKRTEVEAVFNAVWANNGDAISRAYAGTSALKGDFTRTGRRDLGGMLNDGMNSVVRMYTSTFSDYFSQACIDYLLGHRTSSVFSEFLLNLSSTDPNEIYRLSKIRAAAIETSTSLVLYAGEILKAGWTLLSPTDFNTRLGDRFPEKVLLLSNVALYVVNYDYALDKVKLYTRIPLIDIINIQKGPYILSAIQEASRNPVDNYGFMISFRPRSDSTRLTSYALQNQLSMYEPIVTNDWLIDPLRGSELHQTQRVPSRNNSIISNVLTATGLGLNEHFFVAFKALPPLLERVSDREANRTMDSGVEDIIHPQGEQTCETVVDKITDTIRQACMTFGRGRENEFVTEEDIVSLAEAQRLASVYSKFEYALKRMLWLGLG